MKNRHNMVGQSGFYHFFGIVEDRKDPKKMGRLRVRCFGIHTDDRTALPTAALPWAQVMLPINTVPNDVPNVWEGNMVFGFFADGMEMQVPIIMGTMLTNNGGGDPLKGFSDPRANTDVTVPDGSTEAYSGHPISPGVSTYARGGEAYDSSVTKSQKEKAPIENATGAGGSMYTEPEDPYHAEYPYNHAGQTESGHVIELDDSPGAERVHIFHRSGSFVEFHPDGSIVAKSVKNNHVLTISDKFTVTMGNAVDNTEGNSTEYVGGEYTLEVAGGDMTVDVKAGNLNLTVNGNVTSTVTGNVTSTVTGNVNQTVGGNMTAAVTGNFDVSSGAINMAAGVINMSAGAINLNS